MEPFNAFLNFGIAGWWTGFDAIGGGLCKQTKTATNADPLLPSTAPVIAPAKAIPAVETPNANNAAAQ